MVQKAKKLKNNFFRAYANAVVYFIYTNDASQIIRSQFLSCEQYEMSVFCYKRHRQINNIGIQQLIKNQWECILQQASC